MHESWKQWEGEVIGGEFPVREYLGGSDRGAVFLTEVAGQEPQNAAIRLIPADSPGAAEQLARWREAASLSHPHLLPIRTAGRCELNGVEFVYVVMEYAEENLAQVLPLRPLTPGEVGEMLPPLLQALEYVHSRGLIHGSLRPANIMAVADQLKISSDCLWPVGRSIGAIRAETEYDPPEFATGPLSPAVDVWSLGLTLVEVLMRRLPTWDAVEGGDPTLPEGMPQPFGEIARHCLRLSPEARWTIAEIAAFPESAAVNATKPPGAAPAAEPVSDSHSTLETLPRPAQAVRVRAPRQRRYLVPAAIIAFVLLVMVGLRMIHIRPGIPHAQTAQPGDVPMASSPAPQSRPTSPSSSPAKAKPTPAIAAGSQPVLGAIPRNVIPESQKPVVAPPLPVVAPPLPVVAPRPPRSSSDSLEAEDENDSAEATPPGVLHQSLPHVSQSARETIQGHVRVSVKITVDAAGNVTDASFDSAGPSKYFARLALQSAHDWKFVPAEGGGHKSRQWVLHFAFGRAGTDVRAVRATP